MNPEAAVVIEDPDLELIVLQPGEKVLGKIKRHPIGAVWIYVTAFVAVAAIVVLAATIVPSIFDEFNRSKTMPPFIAGVFALGLLAFLVANLAERVYWSNKWVLTSDSLTQILQLSLFNKSSSQLSLGNIEDVSYSKRGIFPTILNYGRLTVETAGNKSKFNLAFCSDPEESARKILSAREDFNARHRTKH